MSGQAIASLEIRQLRAFIAVAEEGSFVRAAKRLNVAQPALSRTIRSVETRLGVRLLERTTRSVYLTQTGSVFLQEAQHTLAQMARTVQLTREAEAGLSGEIRVGYMDFAIYGPMIELLAAFTREFPLVKLSLKSQRSDDQSRDVAAHRLDVGFAFRHRFHRDLEVLPLTCEPLVAVMPRDHKLTGKRRVSIGDLADESFLMGTREGWQLFFPVVEAFCGSAGFAPRIALEANEGAAIFNMVAAGLGVTVYPSCARNARQHGVVVRDFDEAAPLIETYAIIRRGGYPPIAEGLIESLRNAVVDSHARPAAKV